MSRGNPQRGVVSIYVTLLLALALFGFLVMAVDVGRLYAVQAELQTAAEAAALAAATRLAGTANSHLRASEQLTAAFDSTTGNDNRFNLRLNALGSSSSDLASELLVDYFSTLLDAQSNVNGGRSGADAKYARVEVRTEAPVLFTPFLSPDLSSRPVVAAAGIAGVSSPVCGACGIDAFAVTALDTEDEEHYGFAPGEYYTLYLTPVQQRPNLPACLALVPAPMADTLAAVPYVILNHIASGPETGLDGELFRLGAGGIANRADLDPPGSIAIESVEVAKPDLQGATCPGNLVGRAFLCGLNTRFGVDPSGNACATIEGVADLAVLYTSDTDLGTVEALQQYATEYDGNLRRVLTVAVVDNAATLTVLSFRQFFLENSPNTSGLNPSLFTGAFRAQYIGWPAPIRCGSVGGSCTVAFGVGRVVLH